MDEFNHVDKNYKKNNKTFPSAREWPELFIPKFKRQNNKRVKIYKYSN